MLNKFRFRLILSAVLIALLLSAQTRAATAAPIFKLADAAQLLSLNKKLAAVHRDIGDAFQTANKDRTVPCLPAISTEAQSVFMLVGFAVDLLTLDATMRDKRDEYDVLDVLTTNLKMATIQLTGSRQTINKWMSYCSESATVNVKGQAVINIFSEIEQALAPVADKVQKALDKVKNTPR